MPQSPNVESWLKLCDGTNATEASVNNLQGMLTQATIAFPVEAELGNLQIRASTWSMSNRSKTLTERFVGQMEDMQKQAEVSLTAIEELGARANSAAGVDRTPDVRTMCSKALALVLGKLHVDLSVADQSKILTCAAQLLGPADKIPKDFEKWTKHVELAEVAAKMYKCGEPILNQEQAGKITDKQLADARRHMAVTKTLLKTAPAGNVVGNEHEAAVLDKVKQFAQDAFDLLEGTSKEMGQAEVKVRKTELDKVQGKLATIAGGGGFVCQPWSAELPKQSSMEELQQRATETGLLETDVEEVLNGMAAVSEAQASWMRAMEMAGVVKPDTEIEDCELLLRRARLTIVELELLKAAKTWSCKSPVSALQQQIAQLRKAGLS